MRIHPVVAAAIRTLAAPETGDQCLGLEVIKLELILRLKNKAQ